jgi:predicted ABC-type ATPase
MARDEDLDAGAAWVAAHKRAQAYLASSTSFVIESTLAGRDATRPSTYIAMMHEARRLGFQVDFFFIALDSAKLHVARVGDRVAAGGHDIPRDLILSRYGISTTVRLPEGYDAADNTVVLDASGPTPFSTLLIAERGEAAHLSTSLPEWVTRGLGQRIEMLRTRDLQRIVARARDVLGDPDRDAYIVTTGRVFGTVVTVGAGHIAVELRGKDNLGGLPEKSLAILRSGAPSIRLVGETIDYDVDLSTPAIRKRPDPFILAREHSTLE